MCGILGYKFLNHPQLDAMGFIERLFLESEIRGRHASGFTILADPGELETTKAPLPVSEFILKDRLWKRCKTDPPRAMVAHTRYSTSGDWDDNNNNQPLATNRFALVHNGLVSMGTPEEYGPLYGLPLTTANDSEVILKAIWKEKGSIINAMSRVYEVEPPIFACGLLDFDGNVSCWADNIRPLYIFMVPEWDLLGFASTKDIIMRAAKGVDVIVFKAKPFHVYRLTADAVNKPMRLGFSYPSHPKFERPNLVYKQWLKNKKHTDQAKDLALDNPFMPYWRNQGDCRKNTREAFKQYSVAAITSWEIDPNYVLLNYIFRRYEMSKSQEYWICWLYGVFYHPATLFWFLQEFPEYEKVDLGRLEKWHAQHWKELRYNTDRKYEKGHLVEMFVSYRNMIGSQKPWAQEEFFNKLLKHNDPVRDFHEVFNALCKGLLRFGRYATYIYTEALARSMGMPIQADTIFLKEARSPRAGLCYAVGREEWSKGPLTKDQWEELNDELENIMWEIKGEYPDVPVDYWLIESCLCAFKGFFRPTKGRYIPYYLDRQADEILQLENGEPVATQGVDWKVLWQFRRECLMWELLGEYADPPRLKVQKSMEHVLRDTGRLTGLWPFIKRGILDGTPICKEG